jgi:hypothetical protein
LLSVSVNLLPFAGIGGACLSLLPLWWRVLLVPKPDL